ncbi:hypothetical protein F5878DRAFT_633198 [Lentinula raphanica]|uniref:F-box domain-containing protein n=1 Tax=Lentinula raphanica TaxID=153919 RepID=A0AA38NZ00_9AGAR|nr:hypothetical protein C8R42DRAFT_685345 [Lentinula raphanica]KAJ3833258.1 hypothetical protein F5878DRAFT_633198 [Lentinula raphanica]
MLHELFLRLYQPFLHFSWRRSAWLTTIFNLLSFFIRKLTIMRRRSPSFPDLPVEVLMEIFQFATYLQESESILPLDPFIPQQISHNALGPNTDLSTTRTKCALVLVCRSWRNVAIPLLYRNLVIRSPRKATLLLSALESSYQTPPGTTTPSRSPLPSDHGRFARHLEIFTHSRGSNSYNFLMTICRVVQRCPNLRILSGSWNHALPSGFRQSISQMCKSNVREMFWSESDPDSYKLAEFMNSFQNLRVLDISRMTAMHNESALISLPSVQDLIMSIHAESVSLATSMSVPKLHTLVIRLDNQKLYPEYSKHMKSFLQTHATAIRTLHLLPPPGPNDQTPLQDFHTLFEDCACLETVTFHVNSTPDFHHPSVRRVGVRGLSSEAFDSKTNNGSTCLKTLADRLCYPCLETVRTVEYLVENHITSQDHYIWWCEQFERRGVDFQDGAGIVWLYSETQDVQDTGGTPSNEKS